MNKFKQLQVGQVVKNYKEMCRILEQEIVSGKSKQLQIKDWERYIKYSKQGHKFIIDEIYDEEIINAETRGRKSIYGDAIQLLILDLLGYKNGKITISKSKLMNTLGMTNENYSLGRSNLNKLSKYLNMDVSFIYDFYNVNNSNFANIIKTALNDLESKRVIHYTTIKKLKPIDSVQNRTATEFEIVQIMEIEKEVLISLGYKDMINVRKSKDWNKFKLEVKDRLSQKTNIEYYYNAYEIIINEKFIDYEKESLVSLMLSKIMRDKSKHELNNMIIDNSLNNAKNRQANFFSSPKTMDIRFDANYVPNMATLADVLLNIKAPLLDLNNNYTEPNHHQLEEIELLFQ